MFVKSERIQLLLYCVNWMGILNIPKFQFNSLHSDGILVYYSETLYILALSLHSTLLKYFITHGVLILSFLFNLSFLSFPTVPLLSVFLLSFLIFISHLFPHIPPFFPVLPFCLFHEVYNPCKRLRSDIQAYLMNWK